MENNKSFNRILDFFFVLGTVLVLFTHFSKDYIPSFLFPFFKGISSGFVNLYSILFNFQAPSPVSRALPASPPDSLFILPHPGNIVKRFFQLFSS